MGCERGAAGAHPEDLASREADRAGANDAHRLRAQLEPDQAGQGVVPLAHAQVRMLQVPAGAHRPEKGGLACLTECQGLALPLTANVAGRAKGCAGGTMVCMQPLDQ